MAHWMNRILDPLKADFPSYRNYRINWRCKSVELFLYKRNADSIQVRRFNQSAGTKFLLCVSILNLKSILSPALLEEKNSFSLIRSSYQAITFKKKKKLEYLLKNKKIKTSNVLDHPVPVWLPQKKKTKTSFITG